MLAPLDFLSQHLIEDDNLCSIFRNLIEDLLERMVQKGGVKSLLLILTKSIDLEAQRFAALALGNISSAGNATSYRYVRKSNLLGTIQAV